MLKVWNAFTGQELASLPHNHIVKGADFANEGTAVVTGGQDKCVRVFDVNRPDAPTTIATHEAPVRSIKRSKHTHTVISAGDDRCINFVDLRTNSIAKTINIEG
ncbi:hypothetical protein GGI12_000921, partial [Dipsacomyces acuminosporus]